MNTTPQALAAALPDVPRLVETRALLRAGTCDIYGSPDAWFARSRIVPLGAVHGSPDSDLLRRVLAGAPPEFELLVQPDDVGHARAALRDWRARAATMHVRPDGAPPDAPPPTALDIRVADPPDAASIRALPEGWRLWAAVAPAFATVWAGGEPVSICEAIALTESYWEAGVGTLDRYRRRGYARAAYLELAPIMAARGLRCVWGAMDDNEASLALARGLGFEPVERLWILTPRP